MSYIDGMVAAVPTANKDQYLAYSRASAALFRKHGAIACTETWGVDVPTGKATDFYRAVQAKPDETIVFAWITWPDKATRDAGWETLMQDHLMMAQSMPFDGSRMIYGSFETLLEA